MAGDPLPDPEYPLRMVLCAACRLAQLEFDPTSADEPRGVEPRALVDQALDAMFRVGAAGLLRAGARVREYPSPHGGSWLPALAERGLLPLESGAEAGEPADLTVDVFGMMHCADQRAALLERVNGLADNGVLLLQFHSFAAILRGGVWNALRHGHFAYYSTPVLVQMARQVGLVAVDAFQFDLYGGTVLLALRRSADGAVAQGGRVTALIDAETRSGAMDPETAATLDQSVARSAMAISEYLRRCDADGLTVAGYGAASRSVALLRLAEVGPRDLLGIGDASTGKQGRQLPGARIPIIDPVSLARSGADRVLLFVPDLLAEVRAALPEVEANGGRWVVLDPMPREIVPSEIVEGAQV